MNTNANAFLAALEGESNLTFTENGATTNISTFDNVLDFFYHAPAKRGQNEELNQLFFKAMSENDKLATKALFYIRDIRGGQGERNTFRLGLAILKKERPAIFKAVLPLIAEYGRWDDILTFVEDQDVRTLVWEQLKMDVDGVADCASISLLAKWMPSINTSSKVTVALARKWAKAFDMSEKRYRQLLSELRTHLQIVEQKMSNNAWGQIEYPSVPSRANLIYKNAFKKHDAVRYDEFIAKAVKGEVKINSGTLYPADIVHKYLEQGNHWDYTENQGTLDQTLEALWNQLPNYADSEANALVVADTSGSMYGTPLEVCLSLAIYIAERNKGVFHDKFITFSEKPKLQSLVGNTLREKITNLNAAEWSMNTNIQAVFDLILHTATSHKIKQEELPEAIFVISDMEFDCADRNFTNFHTIQNKFNDAGYILPKLIFWNVASRGQQAPVTKDERGVYLVSGYSPSIFQKAINAVAVTPIEMMLEVLNCERYNQLDSVLTDI